MAKSDESGVPHENASNDDKGTKESLNKLKGKAPTMENAFGKAVKHLKKMHEED
jgi:hypothetical protein